MTASRAPFDGLEGTILPGLVDIQVNGAYGCDFTSHPDTIWEVAARLPRHGVTAFLPTIITALPEAALAALEVLAAGPPAGWRGAHPLGLHVEGPMISPARRGAHPAELLTPPSESLARQLIEAGPPTMVTLAPELPGAEKVVRTFAEAGTVVAVGHSDATADQVGLAVEWGARHVTHLYNAMSGLDHRHPGVAAAALVDDRLTVGLIADGVHVSSPLLELAHRAKGPGGIALVTDAIAALGLADGDYVIGSVPVSVAGGTVRTEEGTLAGAATGIDQVVRVAAEAMGCPLKEAAAMASATPARIVGHDPHPGDLVLVDDGFEILATAVRGEVLYRRDGQ